MIDRRHFLETLGYGTAALGTSSVLPSMVNSHLEDGQQQPNIVFLFSDDHSVPDLGCYGNDAVHTPHLDELAGEGIRFDRAYVPSAQCSPSRAAVLTGRAPHAVGASRLHAPADPLFPDVVTLLKEVGYYTGAYRKVHQPHIEEQFDFYGDDDRALSAFFEQAPADRPLFLWFGCHDPHRPYGPGAFDPPHDPDDVRVPDYLPDTPEVRQDLAFYYDEIARFDRESGEILALLEQHGLADDTMVVMGGDNGLPFPRAKATLYEPGVRVPLLVKWPGVVAPGETTEALVSLVDLTATWLEAAGLTPPPTLESRSLLPLLTGETSTVRERVFAERNWHDNWDPMRCIIGPRYKLIQNYRSEVGYQPSLDIVESPSYQAIQQLEADGDLSERLQWYTAETRPRVEFYDLQEDPGEWSNLAEDPACQDPIRQHQQALSDWMNATHDFLPPPREAFPGGPDSELNATIEPLNGTPRGDE